MRSHYWPNTQLPPGVTKPRCTRRAHVIENEAGCCDCKQIYRAFSHAGNATIVTFADSMVERAAAGETE